MAILFWLAIWLTPTLAACKLGAPFRVAQAAAAAPFFLALRRSPRDLGLTAPERAHWFWTPVAALMALRLGFAAFVLASIKYAGMSPSLSLVPPPPTPPDLLADILLLAPVLEEVYYRGVLYRMTESLPRWPAIFAIAALFAADHFASAFVSAACMRSFGGLTFEAWLFHLVGGIPLHFAAAVAFGFVRWRSGSVFPAIILHLAVNTLQIYGGLDYGTPLLPRIDF